MKRTAMLRRTPMSRGKPAAPPARPERRRALPAPAVNASSAVMRASSTTAATTIPKHEYVRSPKLLAACGKLPCQHCGKAAGGEVCAAHSNWHPHNKGTGIKANDVFVAAMCGTCHIQVLDQGSRLSKRERQLMWWLAHVRTIAQLVARALWPAGVPLPDIDHCPWELLPAQPPKGTDMPTPAERARKVIAFQLDCAEEDISDNNKLVDDLLADSLDTVEIVMGLEDEFGIEISDPDAEKFIKVKDIVDYVEKRVR